ncbi:Fc.00g007750.m01.CDS01 [Cosmosporella sp. VM-42]
MADIRRLTDLIHGHVGTLTYIPHDDEGRQPGTLHTSRDTSSAPCFKVIGSSAELYPPSKTQVPEGSSHLWQERRTQRRWLLKSHPQAFMGNSALQGFLEENMNRFQKVEGEASDRPLLAIGEVTNVRDPSRVSGALALAVATGESGELLRLARIDESKWQWGQSRDVGLKLSVIDPDDQEEEVIWASDSLPISQIKFATSLSRYDSVRWLLVQKQTSTTILQPEYHKVPVSQRQQVNISVQQRLSRIDPNPLLTISHKHTGGNAHTDVDYNPGSRGLPPQIALIDECGYWSVWNILGSSRMGQSRLRLSTHKCGHILEGLREEIPPVPSFPAEKHGILFVGTAEIDSFWEDPSQGAEGGSANRSQHVTVWNRERFEVFDLKSNNTLPKLANFTTAKAKPDWILDIQLSPVNQNHIFVLTKRSLYWIDLFTPRTDEEEIPKPSILITCPNLIAIESMRMTTCRATEDSPDVTMVVTYSPENQQLHTYWFGLSKEKGLPQWHRQVLSLPHDRNVPTSFQSIELRPAKLLPLGTQASGPGSEYQHSDVHFYQGSILGKDLSVRYCICASFQDRDLEITLPTTRIGQSRSDQAQRWKRKRKHFLRHMGTSFVLPDGVADANMDVVIRPKAQAQDPLSLEHSDQFSGGAIFLKLNNFCRAIQEGLANTANEAEDGISSALLSAVQETIENGVVNGNLPLTTWQEISRTLGPSAEVNSADNAGQVDMFDLLERADEETVVTHLGRDSPHEPSGSLVTLAQLNDYFSHLWLGPLEGRLSDQDLQIRRRWVAEIAREVFLSSYGVMVQDTRLLGSGDSEAVGESQMHIPNPVPIKSSQSSAAPSIASSPPAGMSASIPDAAFQRLRLLAPSLRLDKMSSAKQSTVLSYWPSEGGVGTQNYVSSVAIASDKKFDEARQRLQRIEGRRKAQAEKYKLPALRRRGFPESQGHSQKDSRNRDTGALPTQPVPMPLHAMSSQYIPNSSQSQGFVGPSVAMSQPMPGAFGDRKKGKKGKRKSGFR